MNTRDKIGLWADEQLTGLYWKRVPLKSLVEKVLTWFTPRCSYRHWETGAVCHKHGEPCWMPNYYEDEEDDVIEWVCYEHMHSAGFCRGCRQFWGGCEDFDFDPQGLCSNCRHDPDYTDDFDDDYGDEDWGTERDEDIAPGDYGYYN